MKKALLIAISIALVIISHAVADACDQSLEGKPETGYEGTIEVNTIPDNITVYLAGVYLGRTPLKQKVPTGRHNLNLLKDGEDVYKQRINICMDNTMTFYLEVKVPLPPIDPETKPADVPIGKGFRNVPFGTNVATTVSILEKSGYAEASKNLLEKPAEYINYFSYDENNVYLCIALGEYPAKVTLRYAEYQFYEFEIQLPYASIQNSITDATFMSKAFSQKYGTPSKIKKPSIKNQETDTISLWTNKKYSAHIAIKNEDLYKYQAIGVVSDNILKLEYLKSLQNNSKKKIKNAADSF